MKIKHFASLFAASALLAACGGGDVNISPKNVVNNDGQTINEGDTITNNITNNTGSSDTEQEAEVVGATSTSGSLDADPGATFEVSSSPSNGFAYVDENGDWVYRPNIGFRGVDRFEITVGGTTGTSGLQKVFPGDVVEITVDVQAPSSTTCASYTDENDVVQAGSVDSDGNCVYDTDFADVGNPVLADLDIPNIGNAAHIFEGSLFIGENFTTDAGLAGAGIAEGGDGPTLTIAAGATLAFQTSQDFMVINRGSQIVAEGTQVNPITITSTSDVSGNLTSPEAVSQWGGLVINGFGVTNKCDYTGTVGADGFALDSECHVASEGSEGDAANHYGGDNNADSSGTLEYFIVKHTGATVGNGDELNGITFSGVGSGTTVANVQAYSTYDDGFEFFGGAVNVTNFVALYVNDDSIDIDEGYRGTITNALVIQSETDGNRCIEADGIGSYSSKDQATIDDFVTRGLNSRPTISNLTCIISPTELFDSVESPDGTGTHDPGQGFRLREALFPTINNALVTSAYLADAKLDDSDHNYCFRVTDLEGMNSVEADDGNVSINGSIFACQDLSDTSDDGLDTPVVELTAAEQIAFLEANGNQTYQTAEAGEDPTEASNGNLEILDGFYSLPVADAVVNGAAATVTPVNSATFVGAVSADDDWTQGWAYGLEEGNRGQSLYFEPAISENITRNETISGSSLVASLRISGDDLALTTAPSNGYAFADGSNYVYRPEIGFTGVDTFVFTAGGVTQTVNVTVEASSVACASYTDENDAVQAGTRDNDGNCVYDTDFAAVGNPILTDLTLPNIGNAAHIFEGSLFIGENFTTDAGLTAAGITEGGDGPTLTIAAGATLAFQTSQDFMVINRGSQIVAEGTKSAPITITSTSDINGTISSPEAVSQWGGLVINGFGVTNKCDYTGTVGADGFALDSECHVASEGSEGDAANHYGGDNNADSSGTLEYFMVKHTGATVGNGDELNGITFSGVGSGTTVANVQAYSTYDDGFEFFGGAVNVTNFVALYVNDDSIDIDEGYRGTITNALVIQSETDGNRCIEADGIGSYSSKDQATIDDFVTRGLNSRPTISNLTCIISPTELFDATDSPLGTGTHDPGQGFRLREALFPTINNALVTSAYLADAKLDDTDHNYCFRVTDLEGMNSVEADDGNVSINGSIFACQDISDTSDDGLDTPVVELTAAEQIAFLEANGNQTYQSAEAGEDPTEASNTDLEILDGFYSLPIADTVIGGAAATVTPENSATFVGAMDADNDWAEGWAFGLHSGNRGQALYFEAN